MTKQELIELLTHAKWHCLFGSEPTDREATEGDKNAAAILQGLIEQLSKPIGNQHVGKLNKTRAAKRMKEWRKKQRSLYGNQNDVH